MSWPSEGNTHFVLVAPVGDVLDEGQSEYPEPHLKDGRECVLYHHRCDLWPWNGRSCLV